MGLITFINKGTPCHICGIPFTGEEEETDKPVVLQTDDGLSEAYHWSCLPPEVVAQIRENEKRAMARFN